MSNFKITSFQPDYQRSGNIGDDRKYAVSIRAAEVVCSACGTSWRATPSRDLQPGRFQVFTGNFSLSCAKCDQQELIELRPLLLLAKGQHTVTPVS